MERQFPKNVRQIGNVCDEPKIYVEDYVDTYLNQLKEKAVLEPVGVILAGEIVKQEGQDVVYISGAIQMKGVEVNGTEVTIGEEAKEQIKAEKEEYFQELGMVGWCLIETGHPMGLSRGVNKMHGKIFPEENTIFIWRDAVDNDEMFYANKYGELMQMGGHYIYYEKNPAMQNYMINTRKMNGVTPSEMVEDRAAKDFRSTVREKMEYSMNLLAAEAGLGESQVLCALNIFEELGLLEFTVQPLSYKMIPSGRVSLESSRLRGRLMSMKG